MTQQEFHNDLKMFIRTIIPLSSDQDDKRSEVVVHLQPNMTILSGKYFIESTHHSMDLRTIGKAKRRQIVEKIRTYHWNTTKGGCNKWNVGKWTFTPDGNIEENLLWDIAWEEKNIKEREIHRDHEDLIEPKWHWEKPR